MVKAECAHKLVKLPIRQGLPLTANDVLDIREELKSVH